MSFKICKRLGGGSFGFVYLIESPNSRQYAIKVTNIAHVGAINALEEPATMMRLEHPHILQCFYFKLAEIVQQPHLYMLLEYCERGTLTQAIANGVSEDQAITWFIQMADALTYLHVNKVMHRDIKPDNILLNSNNDIKVGDLGLARIQEFTAQGGGTAVGTYCYMSPQILLGQPYQDKTDVWSLGCVFYQVLSKNPPFTYPTCMAFITGQFQIPPMPSSYSEPLRKLILKVLNREELRRPSAKQILDDLMSLPARPYNRQQYVRLPQEDINDDSLLNCVKHLKICEAMNVIVPAIVAGSGGH